MILIITTLPHLQWIFITYYHLNFVESNMAIISQILLSIKDNLNKLVKACKMYFHGLTFGFFSIFSNRYFSISSSSSLCLFIKSLLGLDVLILYLSFSSFLRYM